MIRQAGLLLSAMLLSACAVGPDYTAPESSTGSDWVDPGSPATAVAIPDRWWTILDDADLDGLLERAAARNLDIEIAQTRVAEARSVRTIARSAFWPQADVNARYTEFEQSIESPGAGGTLIDAGLIPRDVDFYTAAVDASWELDLFGGRRREAQAANARLGSVIAKAEAVRLTVMSETASAYFEMRGTQARLAIAERNLDAQRRTLELTRRKVESGLARRIDELRAEAQWNAARAQLPALRAAMRAAGYRLAVLTGDEPGAISANASASLPASPGAVPVGLRADLLRRRPDVEAAERSLAAATADVGVAKADYFPRLVLSASYGFEAADASDLGSGRARTSAIVPFVRWPVFQGGRLRANLAGADARARAAALEYEKAVLQALADAESAIAAYSGESASFVRLDAAADASIEAADIAERLYEQGLADFLTVLDAQRRRDEAADARAQSHTRLLISLARLYKSLGGGWTA